MRLRIKSSLPIICDSRVRLVGGTRAPRSSCYDRGGLCSPKRPPEACRRYDVVPYPCHDAARPQVLLVLGGRGMVCRQPECKPRPRPVIGVRMQRLSLTPDADVGNPWLRHLR